MIKALWVGFFDQAVLSRRSRQRQTALFVAAIIACAHVGATEAKSKSQGAQPLVGSFDTGFGAPPIPESWFRVSCVSLTQNNDSCMVGSPNPVSPGTRCWCMDGDERVKGTTQ
jgi:hypothetical protein